MTATAVAAAVTEALTGGPVTIHTRRGPVTIGSATTTPTSDPDTVILRLWPTGDPTGDPAWQIVGVTTGGILAVADAITARTGPPTREPRR